MNLIDKYVERRLIEKRKELLRTMNIMKLRSEIARLREHVSLVRPDGADAWRATTRYLLKNRNDSPRKHV